jgi:hypothetical protein
LEFQPEVGVGLNQIGYSPANIQSFAPDAAGSAVAFRSLSASVSRRRDAMRAGAHYDTRNWFEGEKEAEEDLRGPSSG